MTIGENIYMLRRKLKMSQDELSQLTHLDRHVIDAIEIDALEPTPFMAYRLASVLGVGVLDILPLDDMEWQAKRDINAFIRCRGIPHKNKKLLIGFCRITYLDELEKEYNSK